MTGIDPRQAARHRGVTLSQDHAPKAPGGLSHHARHTPCHTIDGAGESMRPASTLDKQLGTTALPVTGPRVKHPRRPDCPARRRVSTAFHLPIKDRETSPCDVRQARRDSRPSQLGPMLAASGKVMSSAHVGREFVSTVRTVDRRYTRDKPHRFPGTRHYSRDGSRHSAARDYSVPGSRWRA